MKKVLAGSIPAILILAFVVVPSFVLAGEEVCPDGGGWIKIDSSDLSLYPVDGAVEYCFKAGSSQSQGCEGGIFDSWPQPEGTCGLSHWSYRLGDPTATPTDVPPTATPTDVPPTATPTDVPPTATPDPTPTDVKPTPSITPHDTTATPTPEDTPTNTPTDVPPTQTPQKPPETGGTDGAFFDDPLFVGGILFIAVLAIAMGAVKLWVQKQKHSL